MSRWLRLILFLPLAFITWQVLQLRRTLHSRAWTYILLGFTVATGSAVAALFAPLQPVIRVLISIIIYAFLGFGLFTLQKDLKRPWKKEKSNGPTDDVDK